MKPLSAQKQWALLAVLALAFSVGMHYDWPEKLRSLYEDKFGAPPVPITFSSRDGLIGKVAILRSTCDKTISVVATFRNATFDQSKTFNLVFSPRERKEIGWVENWQLLPGETVQLSSAGWRTVIITIQSL